MKPKPITRKITRRLNGTHLGWAMHVEDYERAAEVVWKSIYPEGGDEAYRCARAALKAIGIRAPKNAKGAK